MLCTGGSRRSVDVMRTSLLLFPAFLWEALRQVLPSRKQDSWFTCLSCPLETLLERASFPGSPSRSLDVEIHQTDLAYSINQSLWPGLGFGIRIGDCDGQRGVTKDNTGSVTRRRGIKCWTSKKVDVH